jgi:hypothetical protein
MGLLHLASLCIAATVGLHPPDDHMTGPGLRATHVVGSASGVARRFPFFYLPACPTGNNDTEFDRWLRRRVRLG